MFDEAITFENLSGAASLLTCFLLALFYVVSLYLWSHKYRFDRDTSHVIIRRFISVIISCFVSVAAIYAIAERERGNHGNHGNNRTGTSRRHHHHHQLADWIGLKFDVAALNSVIVALLLTMILFSGPIVQHFVAGYLFHFHHRLYEHEYKSSSAARRNNHPDGSNESAASAVTSAFKFTFSDYVRECVAKKPDWTLIKRAYLKNLFFWRNYLVSPFTEEFVFRSCMLPLLVSSRFSLGSCICITPLFFGLAHLHHIIEGYKLATQPLKRLVMQHLFQFLYTYIFGLYSSYLFLRTGNMMASFFSHAFCNLMGFPNINELLNEFDGRTRNRLIGAYVAGFVVFFFLVAPLTSPALFNNTTFSFLSS